MSTTMVAYCELCKVEGPRIHRTAGGWAGLWPKSGEDFRDEDLARREWNAWILEHRWCDFVIKYQSGV